MPILHDSQNSVYFLLFFIYFFNKMTNDEQFLVEAKEVTRKQRVKKCSKKPRASSPSDSSTNNTNTLSYSSDRGKMG